MINSSPVDPARTEAVIGSSGMENPFSWSASRHDTFATCRRRYFYSYYAAAEHPEIKRLKRLSALPLWAGSVVHETIEALLKERDALPPETEQEAIVKAAVHGRMLADWRDSESGSERFRLFEHEYSQPVDAEDKKLLGKLAAKKPINARGDVKW